MPQALARFFPQPIIAVVISLLASVGFAAAWFSSGLAGITLAHLLLAAVLACSVAAGYQFPIHIQHCQKVEMATVSLYLMAVLLPNPALASTSAGLGILAGEMLVRARRGNYYSDVATATSRWIIVVLAGSTFYHSAGTQSMLGLVGAAAVMWIGDFITNPLVIAPMTGERPLHFMFANTRTAFLAEGVQYLLGILGALAAMAQVWALGLLVPPTVLVYMALKNVKEMQSSTRLILESMADTVDLRDPYTGGHSQRVAEMSARMLRTMGINGPEVDLIVSAARVHDIGKIGIPDSVLNKPGRLTPEETAIMNTHPDRGADLLQRYPDFARGAKIVRHHHESWDGTGYPQGLKGTSIPFGARVIAIADSFDAMTSDRPYRNAMPVARAAMILQEGRGKQWDSKIVDAFLQTIEVQVGPARIPATQSAPHLVTASAKR